MKLAELHNQFLLETVVAMYRYKARDVLSEPLLTAAEMMDFYHAYCGGPL